MHPLQAPWPFDVWGMDILGPFSQASSQRKFLVIVVDHFTKWIEAEPLASITSRALKRCVIRSIITRFGIPHALVTDNGRQFVSEQFREFCDDYHIKLKTTSVEHPAINYQTKLANRIILQGLKTRLEGAKGRWVEEFPSVLWSYRVTKQTATRGTPYALAYGCEAMIPAEISAASDRVLLQEEQQNQAQRQFALDTTEEMRETTLIWMVAYKQKISNYFNAKVKKRTLRPGD